MARGSTFLGSQGTNWRSTSEGGPSNDQQLTNYTGTYASGATPGAGNKPYWNVDGINGAMMIEVLETSGGTATLAIEGSYNNSNWYAVGYYRVDGQASLTRVATALAVTANMTAVLQVLDAYPLLRARPTANTGTLTVSSYLIPA